MDYTQVNAILLNSFFAFMLLNVHGGEMAYYGRGQSGKGTTEWRLDHGNGPKKTGETMDRSQNNGSVKGPLNTDFDQF